MSDDEAFIRAIVDQPGNDLPRLVYADWLDERDDPRGAYLRAEAASPGNAERLTPAAAGLDAVWVARVSRPPLGLCSDSLRFSQPGPRLTAADLVDAERRFDILLPNDYQAFLRNWNGGVPSHAYIKNLECGHHHEESVEVHRFRSLAPDGSVSLGQPTVERFQYRTPHGTVRKYLIVADAMSDRPGDTLLLGLSGPECGRVFYLYGNPTRLFRPNRLEEAAPSWSGLLANLTENDFLTGWYDDLAARTTIEKLPPATGPS